MQSITVAHSPVLLPGKLGEVLPRYLTDAVRRCGAGVPEELRLHSGRYSTVTADGRDYSTGVILGAAEMNEILKRLCGGSLYAFSETINRGYLTLEGGIRVGVCGTAATEGDKVIGVSDITGLIIRIPHRHRVCAAPLLARLRQGGGWRGVLIYAAPGVGKTTLLRAAAEEASSGSGGLRTVVVDSRGELNGTLDGENLRLDVLVEYPRETGIGIAVRCLGAQLVICDEIGGIQDAHAVLSAANCGVPLIASTHAGSVRELLCRPALRLLHNARVFGSYAGIRRDGCGGFCFQFTGWEEANGLL